MFSKTQESRIREWIKALRSGDYKQGDRRLRNEDGTMCCLGVACDVLYHDKWMRFSYDGSGWAINDGRERQGSILPGRIARSLGLSPSGDFRCRNRIDIPSAMRELPGIVKLQEEIDMWDEVCTLTGSLTQLNDTSEFTFDEIADILEVALAHPEHISFEQTQQPLEGTKRVYGL